MKSLSCYEKIKSWKGQNEVFNAQDDFSRLQKQEMRKQKISSLFFLSMLLIASVNTTIAQQATNPYCSASGKLSLSVGAIQAPEYDAQTYYWDESTDNSADLFLTFGFTNEASSESFIFTIKDDETGAPSSIDCRSTESMTFVALLEGALILQDESTSKYYACIFDASAIDGESSIHRAQLLIPTGIPSPTSFLPFYFNDVDRYISVAISDGTNGNVYDYEFDGVTVVTETTTITPVEWNQITDSFTDPILNVIGSGYCFYTLAAAHKIMCIGDSTWQDFTTIYQVTATDVVHFAPLANDYFALAVLGADSKSGVVKFVLQEQSPLGQVTLLDQTERAYQFQSERISNFVAYSDDYIVWFNLDYDGNPRWVQMDNSDISTGDDFIAMALSSNKLIMLYDGVVDYYMMSGADDTGVVTKFFSKTFTGSIIEDDGMYWFGLSCVCNSVKRFSCYSSTLNCLVIKKATDTCAGKSLPQID